MTHLIFSCNFFKYDQRRCPGAKRNLFMIVFLIGIGLLFCGGCANRVRIRYEAAEKSPVDREKIESITIVPFYGESEFIDAGEEMTNLVRRIVEADDQFDEVEVADMEEIKKVIEKPQMEWPETHDTDFWEKFQSLIKGDLIVTGYIKYDGYTFQGFVTETVEDPYYHHPRQITVQREMSDYDYDLRMILVDLKSDNIVLDRAEKQDVNLEGRMELYHFFEIFEPKAEEFVSLITGKKREETRYLLK